MVACFLGINGRRAGGGNKGKRANIGARDGGKWFTELQSSRKCFKISTYFFMIIDAANGL
jgi:hypothetical protein